LASRDDIDVLFPFSRSLGHRAPALYRLFVRSLELPGDVAECGVYTGTTSKQFVRYLQDQGSDKLVHLFDTFEGFPAVLAEHDEAGTATTWLAKPGNLACPVGEVVRRMDGMTGYRVHKGPFSETLGAFADPLCFIHADADLYRSTAEVIDLADRCLVPGGTIVFDDYGSEMFPGVGVAIRRHLDLRAYDATPSRPTLQFIAVKRRSPL
jgi:O-methyltransferase